MAAESPQTGQQAPKAAARRRGRSPVSWSRQRAPWRSWENRILRALQRASLLHAARRRENARFPGEPHRTEPNSLKYRDVYIACYAAIRQRCSRATAFSKGRLAAPVRDRPRVATPGSEVPGLQPAVSGVYPLNGRQPVDEKRRAATMSGTFARAFSMVKPSRRLSESPGSQCPGKCGGRRSREQAPVPARSDLRCRLVRAAWRASDRTVAREVPSLRVTGLPRVGRADVRAQLLSRPVRHTVRQTEQAMLGRSARCAHRQAGRQVRRDRDDHLQRRTTRDPRAGRSACVHRRAHEEMFRAGLDKG